MKWKKTVLVIVISVIVIMIMGIIFFPKFMADKIKIPKFIVYSSVCYELRKVVRVVHNEFWISEYDGVPRFKSLPLDKIPIETMATELIDSFREENGKKRIVVSQAKKNREILEKFEYYVQRNMPKHWHKVDNNPDYIVTGYLFHSTPELFLFLIDCQTRKILSATTNYTDPDINTACENLDLKNLQTSSLQVKVINKSQKAQESSSVLESAAILVQIIKANLSTMTLLWLDDIPGVGEPSETVKAEAELIIVRDSNRIILELSELPPDYNILAITANDTNEEITAARKALIKDLKDRQKLSSTIASLKVAIIHAQPEAQDSMETVLTLAEMVNAKLDMTLLGSSYTDDNHLMLRESFQHSQSPPKTAANAVLIIKEQSDGFILELKTLQDLTTIAMGMSADRPPPNPDRLRIVFEAIPQAMVYIIQDQQPTKIAPTPLTLRTEDINEYRVQEGTKFILKRNGEKREYIHPDHGKREDDDNKIYYLYEWY